MLAAVAGLAGVGAVLLGSVGGTTGAVVQQAIVIDKENFAQDDIGGVQDSVITFNDAGTSLTVAAEIYTNDYMVLDVPLANKSDSDANIVATLKAPGLEKDITVFWDTLTRTHSATAQTTTPSPAPLTTVTAQTSDTVGVTSTPVGVSGTSAQVSTSIPTTSSPGLPASVPQTTDSALTSTAPSGSATVNAQTVDLSISTSQPSLSSLITARTTDFSATGVAPTGAAAVSAQSIDLAGTAVQPTGAPASVSGVWYTGTFGVDYDANGASDTIFVLLTDTAVSGTYNTLDLSLDGVFGNTYGGPLSGQSPRQVNELDDERLTSSGVDVRIGPFSTFTVSFDPNPTADASDARLTAATWYTATVTSTDLDGDASADDTFYLALSDTDSDGIYEAMDVSIGDAVFGEGNVSNGAVDYSVANNTDDECLTASSDTASGSFNVVLGVNPFGFSFDTTPGSNV